MALSTDYTLPKDRVPIFPDRCVSCGDEDPGHQVKITTQVSSWWNWVLPLFFFKLHSVEVPCCSSCSFSIKLRRWGSWVLTLCFCFVVFRLVDPFVSEHLSGGSRRIVMMALALVALSPLFLVAAFFPPAVDATASSDSVDYEFRDLDYAVEFAVLNGVEGEDEVEDEQVSSYFGEADADDEDDDKRNFDGDDLDDGDDEDDEDDGDDEDDD